jgi:hypothetical protein
MVAFATGAAFLVAVPVRPCLADVAIDAWRAAGETSSWQCPRRIADAAADLAAGVGDARSVHAEFIDGGSRTLDLDATEGGRPRRAFRLRFPPQPRPSQFMLALFMNDGSSRSACVVQLPARGTEFEMEFPLSAFRQALGLADYSDVDYILLVARRAAGGTGAAGERHERILSIPLSGMHQPGALVARCR